MRGRRRSMLWRWGMLLLAVSLGGGLMGAVAPARAQAGAALETVAIDLWPDYDRPSVLVLLSAQLTPETPLPATVTLPMPAGATLNAVARRAADGSLMADIAYELSATADSLTLTTPDAGFRLEYYVPYEADGLERRYTFAWTAPLSVSSLLVTVQQPAAATSLVVTPAAVSVTPASNGLQLHNLPAQSLAIGETFGLELDYTMSSPTLSAELLSSAGAAGTPADADAPAATTGVGENWPLLAGGFVLLLALAAGLAFYFGRQAADPRARTMRGAPRARRPRKPAPRTTRAARPPTASTPPGPAAPAATARFCHQCGQEATPGDRFCRVCGTPLKS